VQLEYSHDFFCATPPKSSGSSKCEAGEAAITAPPSGPVVSNVYLLIPIGFSPPESTLQCPVDGHCIDHPHTIDVSRLVGPHGNEQGEEHGKRHGKGHGKQQGDEQGDDQGEQQGTVLPAHSFVIEDQEAFQSTWWPVVLVRVKTLDAWNAIAAAKSIDAVDACQASGGCFPENDTNAFLFFQVLGPNMSPEGPP